MTTTKGMHSGNRTDPSDMLGTMGEAWKASSLELPLTLMSESLRFMAHRLQAQADHISELSRCKTLSEALESQASFTRKTVSEYVAETGTLMTEARSVVKFPDQPRKSEAA